MTRFRTLLAAAAAGLAAVSCTTIGQEGDAAGLPEFREAAAPIFGDEGTALFKADRAFALAAAGNEQGRAFAFEGPMVRITPAGREGLWVRCTDLQPGLDYCAAHETDRAVIIPRTLPNCPGDPRCPKRTPRSK